MLGLTRQELGASEFARWAESGGRDGAVGGPPPATCPEDNNLRYRKLAAAISRGIPESVKTTSLGGIGVALAWMAFGAELGLEVDLGLLPTEGETDLWGLLFSESTGRFLITVTGENAGALEGALEGEPLARLGVVTESGRLAITSGGNRIVDSDVMELKAKWKSTLAQF
jgi:phosphoribosylformylglycinamidine synthase